MAGRDPVEVGGVRLGVRLPLDLPIAELVEMARRVEAAGCESVWVGDHLVWPATIESPYPYASSGAAPLRADQPFHDPLILLTAIAASTERIRLATGVYILPLRPPLVTARAVASLDEVSSGRTILGVGIGWMREEFEAAGADFDQRAAITDEIVAMLRTVWQESPGSFAGEHVEVPPLYLEPRPPQGAALPIHVGGETDRALARVARLGDGWVTMRQTVESLEPKVAKLERLRREAGRADPVEITVRVPWPLTVEELHEFGRAGADRVLLRPWSGGDWRDDVEELESLASAARASRGGRA